MSLKLVHKSPLGVSQSVGRVFTVPYKKVRSETRNGSVKVSTRGGDRDIDAVRLSLSLGDKGFDIR